MLLQTIEERIKKAPITSLGVIREYAVLIPLIYVDGELRILYELRAMDMKVQPGEISFPGGGVELGESYKEAAIRETIEELRISKENIEVFGEIDYVVNGTREIHCFVVIISGIELKDINHWIFYWKKILILIL